VNDVGGAGMRGGEIRSNLSQRGEIVRLSRVPQIGPTVQRGRLSVQVLEPPGLS